MSIERINFFDIFQQNPDGSLSPKVQMNVNGIQFGPGVSFSPGVSFGGVDFYKYKNLPVAVEKLNGIFFIKGFYQS